MQFETTVIVLGAKASKGEYNGRPFDSTKVFYQSDLQEGENFAGFVSTEVTWGTSFNFERIKNLEFPFSAKAKMQSVSNGKDSKIIMLDLVPEKVTPKG
ncbi:hypothetical protein FK538_06900 [Acinetobacter indicus]|uniref:hypothetical protein n=1 Tax=Acinetobacter indicus TaxID=756892 RepID=UPI0014400921|nr:hypothetical protein [Acinetobacter indicus]MCO8103924.1 hypothetical protein [Acinetobacter indicus]QIZ61745.1 hypothetical protein FK538_06900 [Acinetobacter indicus]